MSSMRIVDSRAVVTRGAFARLATHAMGTRFELALYGENERHLRAVGEEAVAEIQYLHEKFSFFSKSSIVTRINERAAIEPVDVDRETFDLLTICLDLWQSSNGAFDITIAPLMRRWGFRPPLAVSREDSHGSEHLLLDPKHRTIRFTTPGIEIDLGGIAKGYALDRAAAILRDNEITTALIHGGTSTVIALGSPPTGGVGPPCPAVARAGTEARSTRNGWRIRIHDEIEPLVVSLRDAALSVSAPRGRTVTHNDQAHGHIIDPRTGEPASCGGATTVAVIAGDAIFADAWSTALLVLNERPDAMPRSFVSMIRDESRGWRCTEQWHGRPARGHTRMVETTVPQEKRTGGTPVPPT